MDINGTTTLYGIIGYPVAHSLSPLFQGCFIDQAGINAAYLPFAVAPDQLDVALNGMQALGVAGFNVTVPHKEQVWQRVDADADACRIGAVNTVRRSAQGWQGTNTDWLGFSAVVQGLQVDLAGADVLLFGAGGTSRAVVHAMATLKPARLLICNRNQERLAALLAHASTAYPNLTCVGLPWDASAVAEHVAGAALLVNTTSIGLHDGQSFPFMLGGDGAAIDAVYRPDGITPFCQAAIAAGRVTVDGLPMLIAQGAASFAWWHGCDMPGCLATLRQVEAGLPRAAVDLPGWQL